MLISTYNPGAQATCPTCKRLVDCLITDGNLAFSPRYMAFEHDNCGTKWKYFIDEDRVEILNKI